VILATPKPGATRAEVQAWMKAMGVSEFMQPSSVTVLDAIPVLGSGKTNYVALAKDLRDSGA
jgi:acyl-[acyl-carrier-protein]-phospholipid O-acyltransferase / long-chain-fatty-acid--[acyl-carrier-protein] ligase